ncbi:amino acid ABC transporter permease [Kiloniella sp. b19]|uniref:amino acid ABC transporter permease n=1 Tax=Kiloniella sp. GXU_MW_B19 TaxID=3141326 RepID=UPI0031DEF76B
MTDSVQTKAPSGDKSFWNEPKNRSIVYQLLVLLIVVGLGWSIFDNTLKNLEARGISTGFDFLSSEAGFAIIQTLIEFNESSTYGDVFIIGLLNTLLVAVIGIILATVLGFIMGVARLSPNWLVRKLAEVYIEIFRNVPLLLQIFFWYHAVLKAQPGPREVFKSGDQVYFGVTNRGIALPEFSFAASFDYVIWLFFIGVAVSVFVKKWARERQVRTGQQFPVFLATLGLTIGLPLVLFLILGIPVEAIPGEMTRFSLKGGTTINPEFIALTLALVVYTAAFIAEIVRAGIQAVSYGQTEASRALGLQESVTLRLVIIPQAMRVIVPPLTSQFLNLTKNSSLAAAIAYPDLVSIFAGTSLNQTGQALEIMGMTLAIYLLISLLTSVFMNWYNSRIKLVER